jgi:hypothetical protein
MCGTCTPACATRALERGADEGGALTGVLAQNKSLLASLNETKTQSIAIEQQLSHAATLQQEIDRERFAARSARTRRASLIDT